jgi:hypothetical protein
MTPKARLASEAAIVVVAALIVTWAAVAGVGWFERHVAPLYCVAGPIGPWQAVRVVAVAVALVLVVVVRPRLGRAVAAWPKRELAVTGVGIAVALVAALGLGELILRRIKWDDRTASEKNDLPEAPADPRMGWAFRPGQTRTVTAYGRAIEYAIGDRGERVARPGAVADATLPTLIVAGESIGFGYELSWDETFPVLAGQALGLQAVNLSVPAYGTDQVYLAIVDALPRFDRPSVVVVVFVPQEIRRNVAPIRPHFAVDASGALVRVPAASGLAAWRLLRLAGDEPIHGDAAMRVTRALLVATAQAVRARGARPLFLVTNYGAPCRGDPPWMMTELFDGLPTVHVDLDDADVFSPRDPHPNARGAGKLAEAIVAAAH